MDEAEGEYADGVGPEDMLARKLWEIGWLMREQERAEAELDLSFAAALRARLMQPNIDAPLKQRSRRNYLGPLGVAVPLVAASVALNRLRSRAPHQSTVFNVQPTPLPWSARQAQMSSSRTLSLLTTRLVSPRGRAANLAQSLIPTLGTERFFELW